MGHKFINYNIRILSPYHNNHLNFSAIWIVIRYLIVGSCRNYSMIYFKIFYGHDIYMFIHWIGTTKSGKWYWTQKKASTNCRIFMNHTSIGCLATRRIKHRRRLKRGAAFFMHSSYGFFLWALLLHQESCMEHWLSVLNVLAF